MKKGLIVLGASAAILASVLAPATSFAAEKSVVQSDIEQQAKSYIVKVGGTAYLPTKYKFFTVVKGSDIVLVDMYGTVRGLKEGVALIKGVDDSGNTEYFHITVFKL